MPTPRVAVYARVSSAGQRDRHTIESQLRDVPAYCARQGWEVVATYTDDGRSAAAGAGKLAARDAFARLVADAAAGRFEIVAVVDQDRITRTSDLRERGAILGAFQAAGVQVAIASTGQILDYRTDEGDLLGSLGAYFAAVENRKRTARTTAGAITAAGHGRKPRGSTPYGLRFRRLDHERHEWTHDPGEAEAVREIYQRTAAGEPAGRIAADLERRGLTRPRGGRWNSERVRGVVASDVYVGRFVVDRRRGLAVAVPPIVDAELAIDARGVLAGRYRRPPPRQVAHHLLTGLARCGLCGAGVGIAGTTDRALATQPVAYRCLGRRSPRPGCPRCDLPLLRVVETDAQVWAAVIDAIGAVHVDQVIALAQGRPRPASTGADARAELDRIDRAQDAALTQLARGVLSQAVADAQVERLARQRQAARAALAGAEAADRGLRVAVDADAVAATLADLRAGAEIAPPALRRQLVRALVGAAVLRPTAIALDLRIDVATTREQVGGSAAWTALPVRLGRVTVAVGRARARRTA